MSPKMTMPKPPSISVVVLTRNRPALLFRCLAALSCQTVKPGEVLIIDGSDNRTKTIRIASFWKKALPLRIIYDNAHSIPYARDLGGRRARGKLVAFVDDDLMARPDYLARMRDRFVKNPTLTAVMGRIVNALPDNIFAATQFAYYDKGLREHFPTLRNAQKLTAGRMLDCEVTAFRKSVLTHIGFSWPRPAHFRHDDVELGLRLIQTGASILFEPAIIAEATLRTSLFPLWVTAFWNGYADAYSEARYAVNLRSSPYPAPILAWIGKETWSKKAYPLWKKCWYAILLISFPAISKAGKTWYIIHNAFYESRHRPR